MSLPVSDGEIVRVRIEVPRGSWTKRKASGAVDLRSPLPCPYDYGSVLGTTAPDGDPLDALVLGTRSSFGDVIEAPVRAAVRFFDAGIADPKLVCSASPLTGAQRRGVWAFFVAYGALKRARVRVLGLHRGTFGGVTGPMGWYRLTGTRR